MSRGTGYRGLHSWSAWRAIAGISPARSSAIVSGMPMDRLASLIQVMKARALCWAESPSWARPAALASFPSFSQQAGPYSSRK